MKRTPLSLRALPAYSLGEEVLNSLTHGIGALLALAAGAVCILCAARNHNPFGIVSGGVYAICLVAMFTISSVYHGLKPTLGKKVMQVIDHCTIYFLIAGTYTVVLLSALRLRYPGLAWGLFGFQWAIAALAVTLTAIDLKKYSIFSMVCYIGMGWSILPFWRQTLDVLTRPGFLLLLLGGIAYTIGSVLYGLGSRRKWMHSIFHIFVVLGAGLQALAVIGYAL